MTKTIESMLTEEELTLLQSKCDPLLMAIYHFDTTYEFSDSLSAWRAGNEGHAKLKEEIANSDYSAAEKETLVTALSRHNSDEYISVFPQVQQHINKYKAKGWLGLAARSISYAEVSRAIVLKRYIVNLHKLISNLDTSIVWSPAFSDNPGLFRGKATISDDAQALVNNISRMFTTEDFKTLNKIEELLIFPEGMENGRVFLYMTLSDFLVTYESKSPGEVVIVDAHNHIFDRDLVTVDKVSFMLHDTPSTELLIDVNLTRDGDSYIVD